MTERLPLARRLAQVRSEIIDYQIQIDLLTESIVNAEEEIARLEELKSDKLVEFRKLREELAKD